MLIALLLCMSLITPAMAAGSIQVNAWFDSNTGEVTVEGKSGSKAGDVVTVQIRNPQGQLEFLNHGRTEASGTFVFKYRIFESPGGTYAVSVGNGSGGKGTASFYMNPVVNVSSIGIVSDSDKNEITEFGGSLQLTAKLLPENTDIQFVVWTVSESDGSETEKAVISEDGLLTAKRNGLVKVTATATDSSGATGSLFVTVKGQTIHPDDKASVSMTGPSIVVSELPFASTINLDGVAESVYGAVYAVSFVVRYDESSVDFLNAESLAAGFTLITQSTETPGELKLLAVSQGADGAVTASGELLKLNWQSKKLRGSVNTVFTMEAAEIANGYGDKYTPQTGNYSAIIQVVGKLNLQDWIKTAKQQHDAAVEGHKRGQYPLGSKAVLKAAIDSAELVAANASSTQEQVNQAAEALSKALIAFNELKILYVEGDLNDDGDLNLGDLGLIGSYYGKTSASPDWNLMKHADYNKDGVIDLLDLVELAKQIK